jgi:hypothetical protein
MGDSFPGAFLLATFLFPFGVISNPAYPEYLFIQGIRIQTILSRFAQQKAKV